jgi:hypothetical protein
MKLHMHHHHNKAINVSNAAAVGLACCVYHGPVVTCWLACAGSAKLMLMLMKMMMNQSVSVAVGRPQQGHRLAHPIRAIVISSSFQVGSQRLGLSDAAHALAVVGRLSQALQPAPWSL